MTENELRKKVVSIVSKWIGGKQGSDIHKEILAIYNEYAAANKMAKAYESYAWCDITASAAWIKAGIAKYVPIAMSCGQSISKAKSKGIWVESDAHKPKIGDAVIYDWDDTGKGDDTTGHDHIGIVVSVGSDTFSVVEGNAGSPSQVKKIQRKVNQRYIRGFITPDYKAAAKELTPKEEKPKETKPKETKPATPGKQYAQSYDAKIKGTYRIIARDGLNLRKGAGTTYGRVLAMRYGDTVTCYGYYTQGWYYVLYTQGKEKYEGFCSKTYLKKL